MSSFRAIVTSTAAGSGRARKALSRARAVAREWRETPIRRRLRVVRGLRRRIGDDPRALAATVDLPWRRASPSDAVAETFTSEVLPLLAACRFLERRAAKLLAPRRGRRELGRRPAWLFGCRLEVRRDPRGVVLVIGPSNYPLFLAGVQAVQALAAGNVVLLKPGRGASAPVEWLKDALDAELRSAGLPADVLQVLPEDVAAAEEVLDAGVDLVVLTGGTDAGRAVLRRLAERPTPAILELSGDDAVIVRADADLDLAARAVAFGIALNGGFTCIAPRRLLVAEEVAEDFGRRLAGALAEHRAEPVAGWTPPEAPEVIPIAGDDEAVRRVADSPRRLGAAVFGREAGARALAQRLDVGVVVVNDVIVPTADPRAPFGGRGESGFGTTRGAEGLLALTTPKTVLRRGLLSLRPHYEPSGAGDAALFEAYVRAAHGSTLRRRLAGAWRLLVAGRNRGGG